MERRFLALGLIFALSACSGGSQQSSQASASPPPSPAATPAAVVSAAAVAAPTATGSANPLANVTFTDISGTYAESAIKQEAALGIFPSKSGKFNPYGLITRAEFVRWLVLANNIYFKDNAGKTIRLAEPNSDQTFVDVPKSSPDFKYIQGMANAGFVIGIDAHHFAPNRNLTREEMIAILVSRGAEGAPLPKAGPPSTWNNMPVPFADRNKISKPYWGAFQTNNGGGGSMAVDEVNRIFGNTKIFDPQKTVSRADAAVGIQQVGFGTFGARTAAYALGISQ